MFDRGEWNANKNTRTGKMWKQQHTLRKNVKTATHTHIFLHILDCQIFLQYKIIYNKKKSNQGTDAENFILVSMYTYQISSVRYPHSHHLGLGFSFSLLSQRRRNRCQMSVARRWKHLADKRFTNRRRREGSCHILVTAIWHRFLLSRNKKPPWQGERCA